MANTKNLRLRLQHQADHLEMIVGTMIPDYRAHATNDETRECLEHAEANLWKASEHLRRAAIYAPAP